MSDRGWCFAWLNRLACVRRKALMGAGNRRDIKKVRIQEKVLENDVFIGFWQVFYLLVLLVTMVAWWGE